MNSELMAIMLPAFVECLVLVGIHSYLGLHVIKRKVIFVDLSLAQIAALGTTVAFLFRITPHSPGAYWFSLGFTFIGAAIFSLSRFRSEKIPQEAIIGLVYALAAAISILVIDKAPQGAEHIKEIMTGSILWVKWEQIFLAAGVYSVVGVFHYVFRKKFLLISNNPELAYKQGINIRFWDFLFYVSFGLVITLSVNTAGVLLVFVFLVVPAIATIMITDKLWLQLVLGWAMGTLVSMIGLWVSYAADLPSGPTVVATYGAMLLLLSLILFIVRAPNRHLAFRNLGIGVALTILVALVFYGMGAYFYGRQQQTFLSAVAAHEHKHQFSGTTAAPRESAPGNAESEMITDPQQLAKIWETEKDDFKRWELTKKLLQVDEKTGTFYLIRYLQTARIPLLREEALIELKKFAGNDFGYDTFGSGQKNLQAIEKFKQWWDRQYK